MIYLSTKLKTNETEIHTKTYMGCMTYLQMHPCWKMAKGEHERRASTENNIPWPGDKGLFWLHISGYHSFILVEESSIKLIANSWRSNYTKPIPRGYNGVQTYIFPTSRISLRSSDLNSWSLPHFCFQNHQKQIKMLLAVCWTSHDNLNLLTEVTKRLQSCLLRLHMKAL